MSTITWLHISDLHWRDTHEYDTKVVVDALLRDLSDRVSISPQLSQIDFILLTGDTAFSGQPEEYGLARQFIQGLLQVTQVPRSRVFAVPGNHDVDRKAIPNSARETIELCVDHQAVNQLLGDDVSRAMVMQRFHRYGQFLNESFGNGLAFDNVRYFYTKQLRISGVQIAVLGLNSAWASASDDDHLNLFLGERQVRAALKQAEGADVRIALMHHPFDWLRGFDRETCEPLLLRACDFVLHGHMHLTSLVNLRAPGSEAMVISAGACYVTREYQNAYNLVQLDLERGKGTVHLRTYSDRQGGFWTLDTLTYPEVLGRYSFDLPSRWTIPCVEEADSISAETAPVTSVVEPRARVEFDANGILSVERRETWSPSHIVHIGSSIGQFVRRRTEHPCVVVGYDTQKSGGSPLHNLVGELTRQMVDVIDLGIMSAPGVAYLARHQKASLGIFISTSGDSSEPSGIRLVRQSGLRLGREEEIEIENSLDSPGLTSATDIANLGQQIDGQHLIELYIQDHVTRCPVESLVGLRIVLDCANGATSHIAPEVFRRLGAEIIVTNGDTSKGNTSYRNGSEYTREYPEGLLKVVRQRKAAYGFAFDRTGHRLMVIGADGKVWDGHDILAILGEHFCRQGRLKEGDVVVAVHPVAERLTNVLSSRGIEIVGAGGGIRGLEAAVWSGGYSLGGDLEGSVIIHDGSHTMADAVYTALLLSGVLVQKRGKTPKRLKRVIAFAGSLLILAALGGTLCLSAQARALAEAILLFLAHWVRETIAWLVNAIDLVEGFILLSVLLGAVTFVLWCLIESSRRGQSPNLRTCFRKAWRLLRNHLPGAADD